MELRFAEFWQQYPKKVAKKSALAVWKRIKPDAELFDRIMQAVAIARNSEQWSREGGRFIPNPTTWLNQGRWDDELLPKAEQNRRQASGQNTSSNPFLALLEGSADE